MALFTQKQAEAMMKSVGASNEEAEVLAALAMAETLTMKNGVQYCDFSKVGDQHLADSVYEYSYGAWQVRSVRKEAGKKTPRDPVELAKADPLFITRAAYSIYKAQGYRAWSTYTSGVYKGFMLNAVYNPKPTLPPGTVMVQGGDTLSKIGSRTKEKWQEIATANNLKSPYTIYPGQVLLLPGAVKDPEPEPEPEKEVPADPTGTYKVVIESLAVRTGEPFGKLHPTTPYLNRNATRKLVEFKTVTRDGVKTVWGRSSGDNNWLCVEYGGKPYMIKA